MALDSKKRAVLTEVLIASGLTIIGFATGQGPLLTLTATAAGIGGNWVASLAERGFQHWRNSWFTDRGALNQDIALALSRAFQDALRQLERDWKRHRRYKHLKHTDPEAAKRTLAPLEWLREDADDLFKQSDHLASVLQRGEVTALLQQDEAATRLFLTDALHNYLSGHDDELVTFIQERLADEWLLRFYDVLRDPSEESTRAWREFQQLWQASLTAAVGQMQQDAAETLATVQWLRDWAQRLESLPAAQHGLSDQEALVASLLHQIVEATLPKPTVYVSTVWERLQPYREAVIQYLTSINYEVISEKQIGQPPIEQQIALVKDCDLFVGIYAHEKGALPDPSPGRQSPVPIDELDQAREWFRRCLIFVASPDLSDLKLEPPQKPVHGPEPEHRKLDVPAAPRVPKGPLAWLRTRYAEIQGRPTPDQVYHDELHEYRRMRRNLARQQEQLDRAYDIQKARYDAEVHKKKAVYSEQKRQYDQRFHWQNELLAIAIEHFPVRHFVSAEDLVSGIQQDLDALERGEIIGFSHRDVLERWHEWVVHHRQTIRRNLPYQPALKSTSPVEPLIGDFLDYAWHEKTEDLALKTVTAAQAIITLEKLSDQIVRDKVAPYCQLLLDCQGENYVDIANWLKDWCEQASVVVDEVTEWVALPEKEEPFALAYPISLNDKLRQWERAISILYEFLDDSSYGKCLLVMGRAGSGKTYLVTRLLQGHSQANECHVPYCLYLSLEAISKINGGLPPIDQLMMASASFNHNKSKGPKWRSFEELAQFVSLVQSQGGRNGKLIIIIDDLDLWIRDHGLDLGALRQFIEEHTNLHNVHWVICLSESNYDLVADPDHERFWCKYGFVGHVHTPAPSGWIGLDHMNKKSQKWEEIIKYQLQSCGKDMPSDLTTALERSSKELLYNPFIAWLFGELLCEGKIPLQKLLNLNYISFVKEFWKQRLDQLIPETAPKHGLKPWVPKYWRAIYLIAGLIMEKKSLVFVQKSLVEDLANADQGRTIGFAEIVEELVDRLTRADLLLSSYDPRAVGKYGDQLKLGVLPLWRWQSGEYLIERLPIDTDIQDHWEAWFEQYFAGDWGQDFLPGVLEFLMLLVDLGDTVPRSLALSLTQSILHLLPLYQSEVWLAASKASAEYQDEVASWLDQHDEPDKLLRGEDLHRYLYFLKYAEASDSGKGGVTPSLRLKLLQPHYSAIQKGEYFRSFLENLVENAKDGSEVAKAFAYLYGIEPYLNEDTVWTDAKKLAEWTYESLMQIADRTVTEPPVITVQQWIQQLLLEERTDTEPERADTEPPVIIVHRWMLQFLAEVSRLSPPSREYERHWVLMTRCHCDRLARSLTKELLKWLEANGWFTWSERTLELSDSILFAMEEQLTTACGRRFREEATRDQKRDYVKAVKEWANGSSDQKCIAVFLIYHTVPSEGPYRNLRVDSRLWNISQRLQSDPDGKVQRLMRIGKISDWYERQQKLRTSRK